MFSSGPLFVPSQTFKITSGMYISVILATVIVCVSAAPHDYTQIFFPDEIEEVRAIAIIENCRKDPTCDEYHLQQIKCKDRTSEVTIAALDTRMKEMIEPRTAGGCNPMVGEVVWPSTGQCVKLLTQGPCSPSHWVKLSKNMEPICAPRPCGSGGSGVTVDGDCRPLNEIQSCPPSQVLFTNEFGIGECDCTPGTVYYQPTQMCYTPYSRGPCPRGSIIKVMDAGMSGHAQCVPNPCPEPNMVRMDKNCLVQEGFEDQHTTCHNLNSQGPCANGRSLIIDNTLAEPLCTNTNSIFGILGPRCSRGSIRDSLNRCRVDFAKQLRERPLVVSSRPRIRGNQSCPPGQTLVAGICLSIFG